MKFKIDENLPAEYAEELVFAGHDAQTVGTEKLTGSEDSVLLVHCKREERVLITLDLDFANVQAYPPQTHPGIVVLRPGQQDKQTLLKLLQRVLPIFGSRPLQGELWIVERDRVRYRDR